MERRNFLRAIGVATATVTAGCSSGEGTADQPTATSRTSVETKTSKTTPTPSLEGPKHGDDLPEDDNSNDGYPPAFETKPDERTFDQSYFGSIIQNGEDVTTASLDVCYYWYSRREARFVDARGTGQYDSQHIYGAVNSPANDEENRFVGEWPTDDRIVCYCGCPHHLSSIRASKFMQNGYEDVYIIDSGYWSWNNQKYPMAGTEVSEKPNVITISGITDERYAGETAWVIHEPSDQIEAAPIDVDGRYSMEVKFEGVTETTPIRVRTPAYDIRAPLDELSDGVVTASGSSY